MMFELKKVFDFYQKYPKIVFSGSDIDDFGHFWLFVGVLGRSKRVTDQKWKLSSKIKPPSSTGAILKSRWSLFSAVLWFDSLEEDLSFATSSFDHPIKANQL